MIHNTAVIDPGAIIGDETCVWHYAHVMSGAIVGSRCVIGQNCFLASTVRVGDGCRIQNNVSLFDGVVLENFVFVGPSAVFTNVKRPRAAFLRGSQAFERTTVKSGATIGANATIVCGVTIGECAFVGAGAVVTKNVSPFTEVLGVPATVRGWICACGDPLTRSSSIAPPGAIECRKCQRHYVFIADNELSLADPAMM